MVRFTSLQDIIPVCLSVGSPYRLSGPFVEGRNGMVKEWKTEWVNAGEVGAWLCASSHGAQGAWLPVLRFFFS